MTGLIFPGIMEDPGATAGKSISLKPHLGPELNKRKSLQIFDVFKAILLKMLENNKNEEVELDASTKSFALVNGNFVNSFKASIDSLENSLCAVMEVPIAVPPKLHSYNALTFFIKYAKSDSRELAKELNS